MWNFFTVLLQIHSGNCLQKIGILDLSLVKLLQNEQGCNFFASQCISWKRLPNNLRCYTVIVKKILNGLRKHRAVSHRQLKLSFFLPQECLRRLRTWTGCRLHLLFFFCFSFYCAYKCRARMLLHNNSVRLSVCHTPVLCQNDYPYHHNFTLSHTYTRIILLVFAILLIIIILLFYFELAGDIMLIS